MGKDATVSRAHAGAFLSILCLFGLYGGYFIFRTSFVIGEERYFALFDDAMISMRYASNLASGRGLIWNPGEEPVEGYTNPLWTLYMALIHFLPIAPSKTSLAVQITSLLLLLANLCLVRALGREVCGSEGSSLLAVLFTAAYLPLNNWALQGMEVGLLAAWASGASVLLLRSRREPRLFLPLCVLLGAGTLVRIDVAILSLAMAALAALSGGERTRKLVTALSIVGGFLLLQTAVRYAYYGETLPNAYYLKIAGYPLSARVQRGWAAFVAFASATRFAVLLPLLLPFFRRDAGTRMLSAVVVLQCLYSIYVGGDAWEWYGGSNRFVSIVMPVLFVLLAALLLDVQRAAARFTSRALLAPVAAAAVAAMVLLLNFHDDLRTTARRWLVLERPLHFAENRNLVETGLRLREITRDDARLAVVWAGSVPYFSDRSCVDILGKNDKAIARGPFRLEGGGDPLKDHEPGRAKWNYRHSIVELKPDVIVHTWFGMESLEAQTPYFAYDLGILGPVYLLDGSGRLRISPSDLLAAKTWSKGSTLEAAGRVDEAISLYRRAIEIGAYQEGWRYHFGEIFVRQRPLAEVAAYYRATVSGDSKPQTSHYFWGVALARAGRFDEAAEQFRLALEIDPAHEMSQAMWGNILALQGRWEEAIEHYREAVAIFPDFASAHQDMAVALRRLRRYDEARRSEEQAEKDDPGTSRRFFYWGRYLLAKGRAVQAVAELEKAVHVDPDDREARALLEAARARAHRTQATAR